VWNETSLDLLKYVTLHWHECALSHEVLLVDVCNIVLGDCVDFFFFELDCEDFESLGNVSLSLI